MGGTVVAVRSCDEVDVAACCADARAVAFDLDNTLARSKMRMDGRMSRRLAELTHLISIAIVSGGRFEQFVSQILDALGSDADFRALHLMPTSGTRYYRWSGSGWAKVYAYDLSQHARDAARESLERHARELGLWEPHTWGPRIEDRGSQITFSALGQLAPAGVKQEWDPNNTKKNALAAAVARDLPHLQVRSGGSTSVDISGRGIDKAYAIRRLAHILGVRVEQIIFIGDRMDPDGNDYPAAAAGTMAIRVADPDQTVQVADRIIASLRARRARL